MLSTPCLLALTEYVEGNRGCVTVALSEPHAYGGRLERQRHFQMHTYQAQKVSHQTHRGWRSNLPSSVNMWASKGVKRALVMWTLYLEVPIRVDYSIGCRSKGANLNAFTWEWDSLNAVSFASLPACSGTWCESFRLLAQIALRKPHFIFIFLRQFYSCQKQILLWYPTF